MLIRETAFELRSLGSAADIAGKSHRKQELYYEVVTKGPNSS